MIAELAAKYGLRVSARAALEVHKDMTLEGLLQRQPRCIKVGDVRFKRSPIKSKTNISYKAIAHIDEGAVVFEVKRSPEMVDDTDECLVFLGAPLYVHPRVTWRSRDILLKDAFASVMRLLIGRKAVERHTSLIGDWLFEPATARVALEKQKDLLTQVIDARPRTLVVGGYKLEYGYNMCDEPDDIELVYIVKNLNIPKTLDLRVYFSKSEVDEGRHEAGEYARVVLYTAKDENFIDDEKVDDGPAFESGVKNAIASMIQKAKNYAKKVYARVSLEHENVDFQHVLDTAPKSFKFGKYKFELFKLLPENDPKLVLYISDKTYEGFDIAMVFSKFNDDVNFSLFYPDSHSKTLYQDDISLHASDREDKLLKKIDDGIKHLLDKERKHELA